MHSLIVTNEFARHYALDWVFRDTIIKQLCDRTRWNTQLDDDFNIGVSDYQLRKFKGQRMIIISSLSLLSSTSLFSASWQFLWNFIHSLTLNVYKLLWPSWQILALDKTFETCSWGTKEHGREYNKQNNVAQVRIPKSM